MSAKHSYCTPSALKIAALAAMASALVAGCSSTGNATSGMSASSFNPLNWVTTYKVDVIQGNFISKEQVEILKPGMTRAQVKDVLGTPLLADIFHNDRWDYVFTLKRRNVESQSFKYTVFFKGDVLDHFEGDTMPSEADFIAKLASGRKLGKVPVLEATQDQLNKAGTKGPSGPASSTASSAASAAPAGLPAVAYPPLETPSQ